MENIYEVFDYANEINVYNEGIKTTYASGDDGYLKILDGWGNLIEDSHPMPALGVSINHLTLEAMQKGLWVEFCFDKEYEVNGMPFEKLSIEVNREFYGFNINRYTSARGYDGRCFYIDLVNKNMLNFYDLLLKI